MPVTTLCSRLAILAGLFLNSCSSVEDQRVRQLLNEKGFGSRAQGIATLENYVTGGDAVMFLVDPTIILQPGAELLPMLTNAQLVGIDGTIYVPYVGPVYVLGMTEAELSGFVSERLQVFYTFNVRVTARILSLNAGPFSGKVVFVFGEAAAKGRLALPRGDLTILDFLSAVGWTEFANLGRVHLRRLDAENPLDIVINLREMIDTANTTYNILIQDNDLIFVPATFFGVLARFLERLVRPIGLITSAVFGVSTARSSYEYLTTGSYGNNYYYPYGRY